MSDTTALNSFDLIGTVGNARVVFYVPYRTMSKTDSISHQHGSYELLYVVDGSGTQRIGEETFFYKKGDVFLVFPQEYHWCEEDEVGKTVRCSFRFIIDGKARTKAERKAQVALEELLSKMRYTRDERGSLTEMLFSIEEEVKKKQAGYIGCLQALCVLFFTAFLRLSGSIEKDGRLFSADELRYGNYWRGRIEEFVAGSYMRKVLARELADYLGMSVRQTNRLLQRECGKSFVEMINDMRVEQAKILIERKKKSLSEIATACGFQNYSYFVNCFSKRVGVTPLAYRKEKSKANGEDGKSV